VSISAVVIARDEEPRLAECLESVSWADETIVVVDDRTLDRTADVGRRFTERVFVQPFHGYSEQRAWAGEQASSDWVFWLDADERATPELRDELVAALRTTHHVAFRVPRLDFMFGRWIRHGGWFPQHHVRAYRRGAVEWTGRVHEQATTSGSIGTLRSPVLHFAHHSVVEWVDKMSRYTTLEAEELHGQGKRANAWHLLLEPPLYAGYKYFIQRGFLDGGHGLVLASLMGCYRLVRNLKLWDLERASRGRDEVRSG
jgi:glycosyltransferase involved in cell wall biosynthesis